MIFGAIPTKGQIKINHSLLKMVRRFQLKRRAKNENNKNKNLQIRGIK